MAGFLAHDRGVVSNHVSRLTFPRYSGQKVERLRKRKNHVRQSKADPRDRVLKTGGAFVISERGVRQNSDGLWFRGYFLLEND
jgi:hypothetical protein